MINFYFSLIFFTCFWTFLIVRIITLHCKGIKALTLSTKNGIKNLISIFGFVLILLCYTIIFIFNSIRTIPMFLFLDLWESKNLVWITYTGYMLAVIFLIVMWIAIYTMGRSWRVGIDNQNPDNLITRGIYHLSRNPIFLGLDGIVITLFLVQPNLFFLLFMIVTLISIHMQILNEEKILLKIYGNEYEVYKNKTKRYFLLF